MEIKNKNFYNDSLRSFLKTRLASWRPTTCFPLLLWPVFATHVSFVNNYFVRHTHYELFTICSLEKGTLEVISRGKAILLHAGETAFIPPGPHTLTAVDGEPLHHTIGLEGRLVHLLLEGLHLSSLTVLKGFYTDKFASLFEKIYQYLEKQDNKDSAELSRLGYEVFMYAASCLKEKSLPEEVFLCKEYISTHLPEEITVSVLCRVAGCSKTHLCELFRKYLNHSPRKYVVAMRIEKSKNLLRASPELSIKEISHICGYKNQFHFAQNFKQHTGIPPNQYRRQ